jgi:hypothetical protein
LSPTLARAEPPPGALGRAATNVLQNKTQKQGSLVSALLSVSYPAGTDAIR